LDRDSRGKATYGNQAHLGGAQGDADRPFETISRLVELGLWRINELTFGVGTTTPRERSSSGCATTVIISVREHAAVFSVQHRPYSFDGTAFWTRTPTRPVQVWKRPGWGIEQAINFEEPGAAPQSANALRDIFCNQLPEAGVS
jgi:hypothetical protein